MKLSKKIVFLVPYFGILPNYFSYWLKSCELNANINWIIFTDDKTILEYTIPKNVFVNIISFHEFKKILQSNFDFNISIDLPYKLTDFKPAYGEILSEYVEGYDFWGFTDIDVIYGDFNNFLNDDILEKYDKVFVHGHLSVLRNTLYFNSIYRKSGFFKKVFSDKKHYGFDEYGVNSYNEICKQNNIKIYTNNIAFADINSWKKNFKLTFVTSLCNKAEINDLGTELTNKRQNTIFTFNKNGLFRYYIEEGEIYKKEYLYVHFQKRKMRIERSISSLDDNFIIIPNKFIVFDKIHIDKDFLKKNSPNLLFSNRRLKRQIYIKLRMFVKNNFGI